MKKHYLFILLCVFTLLTNCSGGDDPAIVSKNTNSTVVKTGKLTGKVISQNGTKPIGGASVFTFDDKYKIYYTTSDSDGNFTLDAPVGSRTIHIQTGDGSNFRTEISATVKDSETLSLNTNQTKLNQVAKIAYVKGTFDKIEDIIQTLGYTATEISNNDLGNLTTIAQYDIIFLNCGSRSNYSSNPTLYSVIDTNLATFVANGGSIYASDWDVAYLVGGATNTNNCSLAGGFIPDTKLCSKNIGTVGMVGATVNNTGLSTALGFNTLNIDFDLTAWQKIVNYDPTYWEVLVKETSTNDALMIRTNHFTATGLPTTPVGNAPTTTFVTVCITLPGNIQVSLSVPQAAVPFLVALGATVGPCSGSTNSGYIYYTTFHNHATGNIGNSGVILQYVILNL